MDVFAASEKEYARHLELPPRKVRGWAHEVEVPARAGDMIHYTSEHSGARGRLEFNVHSHKGKETTYHTKSSDPSIAGAFTVPWEGKFYMMWENTSDSPVRARIHATRHEVHAGPVAKDEGHHHA